MKRQRKVISIWQKESLLFHAKLKHILLQQIYKFLGIQFILQTEFVVFGQQSKFKKKYFNFVRQELYAVIKAPMQEVLI